MKTACPGRVRSIAADATGFAELLCYCLVIFVVAADHFWQLGSSDGGSTQVVVVLWGLERSH